MKTNHIATANLGFPRIGPRRELKFALEKFWAANGARCNSKPPRERSVVRAGNCRRMRE